MSAVASILPLAFGALKRNRMRSLLTSLGVIIGVGALIVTVSSGEGAKAVLEAQLATLGTNLLIVLPGSSTSGGARGGPGTGKPLTHADLLTILKGAGAARYAAPLDRTVVQVVLDDQNWLTTVYGSTPDFFPIRDWTVSRGRFFNESEADSGAKVCVIGQTVATQLLGNGDPIGQVVRVKAMPCEVVGVLQGKGQSSQGQDQDDLVVMPWVTFKSRMMSQDRIHVGSILISAVSPDEVAHAQTQVTGILRQQHRLQDAQQDDFTVRNLADLAATQEKTADAQAGMLLNVAAVSLLVGGIGIMNILLVSVTERTREIGLRMAIGAQRLHVLLQFLAEAVLISVSGGLAGIIMGVALSEGISLFAGWPAPISLTAISGGFLFSAAVGIFFGYYPARKAARLDPIEALRYE